MRDKKPPKKEAKEFIKRDIMLTDSDKSTYGNRCPAGYKKH